MIKYFNRLFWMATVVLLLLFFENLYQFIHKRTLQEEAMSGWIAEEMAKGAEKLDSMIGPVVKAAENIAAEIGDGRLSPGGIPARLKQALKDLPEAYGMGVVFYPASFTEMKRADLPMYFTRMASESVEEKNLLQVVEVPIRPVVSGSETFPITGRVFIDITRWKFQEIMIKLDFGKFGFPFLLSESGTFLWHPREELVFDRQSFFKLASQENSRKLFEFGKKAMAGEKTHIGFVSRENGQDSWVFCHPVKFSHWSLGSFILKSELLKPTRKMRQTLVKLISLLVFFCNFLILAFTFRPGPIDVNQIWTGVGGISLAFVLGIVGIWYQARHYGEEATLGLSTPLIEESIIAKVKTEYKRNSIIRGFAKPIFIPTGLFIQSINFDTAVDVKMTGYIWQKYSYDIPAEVSRGVIFPESSECTLEPAYEREDEDGKLIGWYFSATFREKFSYTTYPFERESIWIRMWHKDFYKNTVLVPFLQSYSVINPGAKPGIEKNIVLPGWEIEKSYFTFEKMDYNSNFGIEQYQGQEDFPELFFNVIVGRNFLDPFISSMLPLLVVSLLAFVTLLTATKKEGLATILGFSASGVLGTVAALFFVVIFAQVDLRRRLEVENIMYLDYYYFANYLIFLLVSFNVMLFCWTDKFEMIQYRDNLIPKIVYWPGTLFFLFSATVYVFYP